MFFTAGGNSVRVRYVWEGIWSGAQGRSWGPHDVSSAIALWLFGDQALARYAPHSPRWVPEADGDRRVRSPWLCHGVSPVTRCSLVPPCGLQEVLTGWPCLCVRGTACIRLSSPYWWTLDATSERALRSWLVSSGWNPAYVFMIWAAYWLSKFLDGCVHPVDESLIA